MYSGARTNFTGGGSEGGEPGATQYIHRSRAHARVTEILGDRTDRMNIGAHRQLICGRPTLTNRQRNAVESDELLQAPKNGLTHRHP